MKVPYSTGSECGWVVDGTGLILKGGTPVVPTASGPDISVSEGRIVSSGGAELLEIDVSGLIVAPAPINCHDHLLGCWAPRVGGGGSHKNVYEWLELLHDPDHPARAERDVNPADDIYMLGSYKHIAAGASGVVDHYMRKEDDFWEKFPMRIFHRYGRTWTLREETGWGGTIEEEVAAAGDELPYIIHVSEGVDSTVADELSVLNERGGLNRNSMLVHGIAFDDADMDLVAESGASIVWCPFSNMFLYGATVDIRAAMERGINVCLGTDSTLSGCYNPFEEARFAADIYHKKYGEELDSEVLFRMLTSNAAYALLQEDNIASLTEGAVADVLVARGDLADPVGSYADIRPRDVDLLLVGGMPAFGSTRHEEVFSLLCDTHTRVSLNGTEKLITGDPEALVRRIREKTGYKKEFPFLPFNID